ncbi:response regulator [Hydrogenophaga sp. PBL-H3]|uniref:response regulator n=1 Tax=Hydrogenophaga sp. PBL-H3 TaxID=434010 RepID=UPI00131F7CE7|nr:response regulator [Hydrogenophaga sp. PBL-H3]QHE77693.1 response regulator [Hydrogenophaga sp. PBL-H3]QHE82117.1 response regulator [Hydrogenophaga sp. PBL-H3]
MKILIVDDDEISRFPLVSLVDRMAGVTEIVQASDGEEAWSLLREGLRPSLCCCDLAMPHLDGVGLLQRVKGDRLLAPTPFVMISSSADRESVTCAVQAGAVGFIVKPYSFAVTTRTLERVLRESQAGLVEPVAQVARRLGITKFEVARLMRKLQSDVSVCADLLDEAGATAAPHMAEIQRMQGSCAMLGLKHCANLLRIRPGETPSLEDTCLTSLREVSLQLSLVMEGALLEA